VNLPQTAKEGALGLSNSAPEAVILGCLVHPFPHKERHRVSRALNPEGLISARSLDERTGVEVMGG
jgi:hypothetical protein